MVERVALAIAEELEMELDGAPNDQFQMLIDAATEAIKAMREPTEKMVSAANERADETETTAALAIAGDWRAMIDAALTPAHAPIG